MHNACPARRDNFHVRHAIGSLNERTSHRPQYSVSREEQMGEEQIPRLESGDEPFCSDIFGKIVAEKAPLPRERLCPSTLFSCKKDAVLLNPAPPGKRMNSKERQEKSMPLLEKSGF
jgi:hypothetical protein